MTWAPPQTLVHDRRAIRFGLAIQRVQPHLKPIFEREVGTGKRGDQVPDVLLVEERDRTGTWVEVENTRKNGRDLRAQVEAAIKRWSNPDLITTPFGEVVVIETWWVLPPEGFKDRRGYRLEHESGLRRAWAEVLAERIAVSEEYEEDARVRGQRYQQPALEWPPTLNYLRRIQCRVFREAPTPLGFTDLPRLLGKEAATET